MNDLLEYLVPVVVFLLWAASQYLEKRKEKGEQEQPPQDAYEQEEQARRIQDEIRRKIAERRQEQQGGETPNSPPPLAPAAPLERPSPYSSPPLSERGQAVPRQRVGPPPMRAEPAYHEPEPRRDLFAELAEQEERMRETQRRAEQARAQARQRLASAQVRTPGYARVPRAATSLRQDLLDTLRDPVAARKAVLYSEVLGTPVGQRRGGRIRPSWEL